MTMQAQVKRNTVFDYRESCSWWVRFTSRVSDLFHRPHICTILASLYLPVLYISCSSELMKIAASKFGEIQLDKGSTMP